MRKIVIDEVIGWWPATANYIRNELESAGGDAVTVEINSPGGSVTEGIAIYNLLRDYPGDVTTVVSGLAASMASYIALAGKWIQVYDNAVYMIHNAWTVIAGDHNEMRKQADILDALSSMLAKRYAKQTGKELVEVRKMMDDESWFFGDEIVAAGFADEVIEGDGETDKAVAVAMSQERFSAMGRKMKESPEDPSAVAAALRGCGALGCSANQIGSMKEFENRPTSKQGAKMENPIDFSALTPEALAQNAPDLVARIRAEAKEEGMMAERKRLIALDEVNPLGLKDETFVELKAKAREDGWEASALIVAVHEALVAQKQAEEEAREAAAEARAEDGRTLAGLMGQIEPGDGNDQPSKEEREKALALKIANEMTKE